MRSRRYGEPRVRVTNDAKWCIRLDCGELGAFELKADEAAQLVTDLTAALNQRATPTRNGTTRPWH